MTNEMKIMILAARKAEDEAAEAMYWGRIRDYILIMMATFFSQVIIVTFFYSQTPKNLWLFVWLSFFIPLIVTVVVDSAKATWYWVQIPFIRKINGVVFTTSLFLLVCPLVIYFGAIIVISGFSFFS